MEKKGKEYDYKGNLIFEGEYLKDIRWNGKIKEYEIEEVIYGYCEYECFRNEYFDENEINDFAKIYDDKILKYEGEYLLGKKWKRKRI